MSDIRPSDPRQVEREQQLTRSITFELHGGRLRRGSATDGTLPAAGGLPGEGRSAIADAAYRQSVAWALEQSLQEAGGKEPQDPCEADFVQQMLSVCARSGAGRPTLPARVWASCEVPFHALYGLGRRVPRNANDLMAIVYHAALYTVLAHCTAAMGPADSGASPSGPDSGEEDEDDDEETLWLLDALGAEHEEALRGSAGDATDDGSLLTEVSQALLSAQIWRALVLELNALLARRGVEGFGVKSRRSVRIGSDAAQRAFEERLGIDRKDGIGLGAVILELLIRATGAQWIDLRRVLLPGDPPRTLLQAVIRPALAQRIQELSRQHRFAASNAPMIARPMPWTSVDGTSQGAYHHRDLSFLKLHWKNEPITRFLRAINGEHYRLEPLANAQDGRKRSLETAFRAVNACQDTAWRINRPVWLLVQQLLDWRAGLPRSGLLARARQQQSSVESEMFPRHAAARAARAAFAATGPESPAGECPESWRAWLCSDAFLVQRFVRGITVAMGPGALVSNALTLATIDDAARHERFWFGYQADTRGRIYPLAGSLSPLGADIARALLEFADGKPIGGEPGARALAVHGSNLVADARIRSTLGLERGHPLSIEDRVRWVSAVENDLILPAAADPLNHTGWRDIARRPFLFLAFCRAWAGWKAEGPAHVCHLPVHIDGSCNGLQHLAVLTGKESLARATNVVPTPDADGRPVRRDIYSEVAAAAAHALATPAKLPSRRRGARAGQGEATAAPWSRDGLRRFLSRRADALLSRDVAKRVVMVIPYGAGQRSYERGVRTALYKALCGPRSGKEEPGTRSRVLELVASPWNRDDELMQLLGSDPPRPHEEAVALLGRLVRDLSGTMSAAIDQALQNAFPVLADVKRSLKSAIAPVLKAGVPVCWVSPAGLPALQAYYQHLAFEKDLACLGRLTVGLRELGRHDVEGDEAPRRSRLRLRVDELSTQLHHPEQERGILPNLIHSLDASHLHLTVCKAREAGVRSFSVIHDSFGTHACDVPALRRAVDEAFIDLYRRPESSLAYFLWWLELLSGAQGDAAEQSAFEAFCEHGSPESAMRNALLNFARGLRGRPAFDRPHTATAQALARAGVQPLQPGLPPWPLPAPPVWLDTVSRSPYFFA